MLCALVEQWGKLYGKDMLVYNVHGLTHLAADAMRFGPLDTFSAFPFENFLGKIKKGFQTSARHRVDVSPMLA